MGRDSDRIWTRARLTRTVTRSRLPKEWTTGPLCGPQGWFVPLPPGLRPGPPGSKEHRPVTAPDSTTDRLTAHLVDLATAWQHPDPAAAARGAGVAFADTIASALAGMSDPAVAAYTRATGTTPFDTSRPAAEAARAAGLAAHALDYDDVDDATISHPSAAVVPALLAVAQDSAVRSREMTGAEAVTALHRG